TSCAPGVVGARSGVTPAALPSIVTRAPGRSDEMSRAVPDAEAGGALVVGAGASLRAGCRRIDFVVDATPRRRGGTPAARPSTRAGVRGRAASTTMLAVPAAAAVRERAARSPMAMA